MSILRPSVASSPAYRWGATALFLAVSVIVAALGFEHIGRMLPCPLCLQQRWAYYAGIPLTFLALVMLSAGHPRGAAAVFGLVALGFLANAGFAGWHAGIEWGFWKGPETCAAAAALEPLSTTGNILDDLKKAPAPPRCDAPSGRFFGLSFAGWNVVACLMISTAALKAALASCEHELYL